MLKRLINRLKSKKPYTQNGVTWLLTTPYCNY